MQIDSNFKIECKWLLSNLRTIHGPTDYFLELHQWLGTMLETGQAKPAVLLRILSITEVRAYIHWIHEFSIEEYSWEVNIGQAQDDRMAAINAAARAYLAELGCTPENDWGRNANPPIA